jgi:hypothetical protein
MLKIFLPEGISLCSVQYFSPNVWEWCGPLWNMAVNSAGICLKEDARSFRSFWNGDLAQVRASSPALVFASQHLPYSRAELAAACAPCGHVPFYDDQLVGMDGALHEAALRPAVMRLMECWAEIQNARDQVIAPRPSGRERWLAKTRTMPRRGNRFM